MKRYLTAREAAQELGISTSTLYSYVSRGLIRSEEADHSRRTRMYHWEDVQRLKARQEIRRQPEKSPQQSLHFGLPVLESALTMIRDGGLYYRGQDALLLAEQSSFEAVALRLWLDSGDVNYFFAGEQPPLHSAPLPPQLSLLEQFQALLPQAAALDYRAYDPRPEAMAQTGVRILKQLAAIAAAGSPHDAGIAPRLSSAWGPGDARLPALINAALILCADHELNASTFAARVTASTGASLYQVVIAGLAALSGSRHGGHTARVAALLDEMAAAATIGPALAQRLKRGDALPGFGHRLYPDGDPRGRYLVEAVCQAYPQHPQTLLAQTVQSAAYALLQEHPSLDFGLVLLARAAGLPPDAALALFAIGRAAGWIGHAIEQSASPQMIRPRARYIGKPTASPSTAG